VLQFEDFHRMDGGIEAVQPQTITNHCKKTRRTWSPKTSTVVSN
jgi:hypothetical protein